MKTIKFLSYTIIALLISISISSCAGDDGAAGQDGNANVSVISLDDNDITWTVGTFLGQTSNTFELTDNRVNQDIIDHGTVLSYFKLGGVWHAMPFTWASSDESQHIVNSYHLNTIDLYAYSTTGVLNPATSEYRFMLITDNAVTASTGSARPIKAEEKIKSELETAGVDINNYLEVCDYYGIVAE